MFRLGGIGLFGFAAMLLWIYCIFDVIASEESLIRNLPKPMWLLIVIFIPTIGSIAWLGLGRPLYAGWRPGDTTTRARPRTVYGPDDDPGWNAAAIDEDDDRERRLRAREAELERRERELRSRETGEDAVDPDDRPPEG
jgi:hypothetical protein